MKTHATSNKLEHADSYTFKYNSDDESIELNTLLLSQINFATVLNEIKDEVAQGVDLSIRIKPLAKGSVPFDIILNVSWLANLLTPDTAAYASEIVGTLVGLIQIRIWLKGKKPSTVIEIDGENITLTIDDTKFTVKKALYEIASKNRIIDTALQKAFDAIETDESITGVEILDDHKKSLINVPRNQFENFSWSNELFIDETLEDRKTSQERLTIFKVVFEKGVNWQFYLNSRKILAQINDPEFWTKIENGEQFAKGDILIVDLEKNLIFDKTMGIYIENGFKVVKVIQHIPKGKDDQQTLFGKS